MPRSVCIILRYVVTLIVSVQLFTIMTFSLGLDCSTQSLTAVVVRISDHEVVHTTTMRFDDALPQYGTKYGARVKKSVVDGDNGGTEAIAPVAMWVEALSMVFAKLASTCVASADSANSAEPVPVLANVAAISVSAQQHAAVLIASVDRFLDCLATSNPENIHRCVNDTLADPTSRIWQDATTTADRACMYQRLGKSLNNDDGSVVEWVRTVSGSELELRFAAAQLAGIERRSAGAVGQRTTRVHILSSFLTSVLAGRDAPLDVGEAAGTNLVDLRDPSRVRWSRAMVDAVGIEGLMNKLPKLVETPCEVVSDRPAGWLRTFGINPSAKIVVGTGDNPATLVGTRTAEPGCICVSLGTSDTALFAFDEAPTTALASRDSSTVRIMTGLTVTPHIMGNPMGGLFGLICLTKTGGAAARDLVRRSFAATWEQADDQLRAALSTDSVAGTLKRCMAFIELLFESTAGNEDRRALLDRLQGAASPQATDVRFAVARYIVLVLVQLSALRDSLAQDIRITRVNIVGGGSSSEFLCIAASVVFDAPVQRPPHANIAAGLGAALVARSALVPTASTETGQPTASLNVASHIREALQNLLRAVHASSSPNALRSHSSRRMAHL
jgi:xylulokinase